MLAGAIRIRRSWRAAHSFTSPLTSCTLYVQGMSKKSKDYRAMMMEIQIMFNTDLTTPEEVCKEGEAVCVEVDVFAIQGKIDVVMERWRLQLWNAAKRNMIVAEGRDRR